MKILFSGGGTLGSVTPLLAVQEYIKDRQASAVFYWLGTKNGPEKILVEQAGIFFESIPSGKLRRYFSMQNFIDVFVVLWAVVVSIIKLVELKPDAVVMAGGFVAVPVGWAAYIMRIPLIIHQQDLDKSLSNKLLSKVAIHITVNFQECAKNFPHAKTTVLGNPVRRFILSTPDIQALRERYNFDTNLPVVLILGGGTGAEFLNKLAVEAYKELKDEVQIINIVGALGQSSQTRNFLAVKFTTVEMSGFLHMAQIVVTRAGLGFISELAALGKPTVIVPMPNSHQEANANFLKEKQAAIVIEQAEMVGNYFVQSIRRLLGDKAKMANLSKNIHLLYDKDSGSKMAEIIIALATKHESKSSK